MVLVRTAHDEHLTARANIKAEGSNNRTTILSIAYVCLANVTPFFVDNGSNAGLPLVVTTWHSRCMGVSTREGLPGFRHVALTERDRYRCSFQPDRL